MDRPRYYNTEWSKSERERQIPHDITHIWNLKYDTNEFIGEIETDSQREQSCGWPGRGEVEKEWIGIGV